MYAKTELLIEPKCINFNFPRHVPPIGNVIRILQLSKYDENDKLEPASSMFAIKCDLVMHMPTIVYYVCDTTSA